MRRNAKLSLDDLDPEVLDAARDVAKRAGVPLEQWIDSAVGLDGAREPAEPLQAEAPPAKADVAKRARPAASTRAPLSANRQASKLLAAAKNASASAEKATAVAKASPFAKSLSLAEPAPKSAAAPVVAQPAPKAVQSELKPVEPKLAEPKLAEPKRAESKLADSKPAEVLSEAGVTIGEMMRRLDALDRSMFESRKSAEDAAARAIERMEDRLASVVERNGKPSDEVIERLALIEQRVSEMNVQAAAPRALGRRGRPLAIEMREAVEKVRQRQRELDAVEAAAELPVEPSPVISELQIETTRLRESLGALATGRDVGALEQAMRTLASDVQRAQEPGELAAIAAPIELMRVQVDRLADEVAANVHARMAGEVERLANKVEGALQSQPTNFADRDALSTIFGELDEIRREIASLAGPERIQNLAQTLQTVSGQIIKLQGDAEALADKMERVSANPVGELIGRLEDIGASLQRPQAQEGDLASIQSMLRSLAEKVDHVGAGNGTETLDALEKQVVAIASRLDQRAEDPSVAGLEKMMDDLLRQVSASRDDEAVEAAVERAARRAMAEAVTTPTKGAEGAIDLLRADLAEIRERQSVADERIQATMGNLNATLERLVDHLAAPGKERGAGLSSELLSSVTLPEARPLGASEFPRESAARYAEPVVTGDIGSARFSEELLDPGMGRPNRHRTVLPEATQATGDVKASFIAAARRAALAAQADMDEPAPELSVPKDRTARPQIKLPSNLAVGSMLARIRGGVERRRRPLILGLAAVVLVLGVVQLVRSTGSDPAAEMSVPVIAANPPDAPPAKIAMPAPETAKVSETPALPPVGEPESEKTTASAAAEKPVSPATSDPATTQSIGEPSESAKAALAAGSRPVPKVAGMQSFKGDLAGLPAPLNGLKQAALDGDGVGIYELASRLADGRGMPRDLALAAKLFEKLAETGYAPAQFKTGSLYEKGSGVIRDLAQAKIWYGRAADQGNIRSMHNLAVIHAENPGAGGKPDFATAATWFKRAAEYGVRDSQYNLAVLYARGLGVGQDLVQSYIWFSAAATHGDEEAGKKREDVASKLSPKDLATAKALVEVFKTKTAETAVNEPATIKAAPMSLMGAPPPGGAAPLGSAASGQSGARASGA